jgi:hypothetical protein
MARQTQFASDQTDALFASYREKKYYEAYRNLLKAISNAADSIEANPNGGQAHPTPYPEMETWGFHWIKVHNYWFGWSLARGYPVVTNVFYVTSGMWDHVQPDEGDEEPFG